MSRRYKVGIIGFGRMGRGYVSVMQQSDRWDIAAICDVTKATRDLAGRTVPTAKVVSDPEEIFRDKSIDVVGLFTLADARPAQIRRARRRWRRCTCERATKTRRRRSCGPSSSTTPRASTANGPRVCGRN